LALWECGEASWYDHAGKPSASGGIVDPSDLTAAHRTLPFGTKVSVENLGNGRTVIVEIDDRGPFVEGRIIDLSRAAAEELGFKGDGTTQVRISMIETERKPESAGRCR
jgi:rare lipoprotein A